MKNSNKTKSILIIDDDPQFAESIMDMFKKALLGYANIKFEPVTSVTEAKNELLKPGAHFDLVTLDGHLSNGELCTELLPDLQKINDCTILLITRDDRLIIAENIESEYYIPRNIIPQDQRFRKGFGKGNFPGMHDDLYPFLRKALLSQAF
jgi:CheY-like chemotaxis protein